MVYTLLLVVVDLFVNLVVNLIQYNPGELIIISIILRAACLFALFPLIVVGIFILFKEVSSKVRLMITSLVIYVMLLSIICLPKSNNKDLFEVYVDVHSYFSLFTLILLPYILASIFCIAISNTFFSH